MYDGRACWDWAAPRLLDFLCEAGAARLRAATLTTPLLPGTRTTTRATQTLEPGRETKLRTEPHTQIDRATVPEDHPCLVLSPRFCVPGPCVGAVWEDCFSKKKQKNTTRSRAKAPRAHAQHTHTVGRLTGSARPLATRSSGATYAAPDAAPSPHRYFCFAARSSFLIARASPMTAAHEMSCTWCT